MTWAHRALGIALSSGASSKMRWVSRWVAGGNLVYLGPWRKGIGTCAEMLELPPSVMAETAAICPHCPGRLLLTIVLCICREKCVEFES